MLAGAVMLGGPWSCLMHCSVLDVSLGHQHAHSSMDHAAHQPHTVQFMQTHDPCDDRVPDMPAHEEPSPLTIAVLLPPLVLAFVRPYALLSTVRTGTFLSRSLSPPSPPPQFSIYTVS